MALTMEEMQAVEDSFLEHSGVKNMKWGQRRYQYKDGSLTPLGRIHYGIGQRKAAKKKEIIRSGDAKKVLKYQKKLTDKEFEKAMARVKKSEELKKAGISAEKERKAAELAEREANAKLDREKKEAKINEKDHDVANKVAKQEAKNNTKAVKASERLEKGVKLLGNLAKLYGSYKVIGGAVAAFTGTEWPGIGSRDKTPKKDDSTGKSDASSIDGITSPATDFLKDLISGSGSKKDTPKVEPKRDIPKPEPRRDSPEPKRDVPKPEPRSVLGDILGDVLDGGTKDIPKGDVDHGKDIVDDYKDIKLDFGGLDTGIDPWGFDPDSGLDPWYRAVHGQ